MTVLMLLILLLLWRVECFIKYNSFVRKSLLKQSSEDKSEDTTWKAFFDDENQNLDELWNENMPSPEPQEPMFSQSYDPLEDPNQITYERDLEDLILDRSLRFFDQTKDNMIDSETCYIVGLEDKSLNEASDKSKFTLEESLTELSELAGAAGLSVCGSSYQRVKRPSIEYYIGAGKVKEIRQNMDRLKCCTVIFDTELTPSQQKNLEKSFNLDRNWRKGDATIKVVDRTALILDIFAQHARTREGKLQVQLALLTYRLPRLTNMWTHLERQSAGARGKSNGGVGLRGPGETQLESDKRQMKREVSLLKKTIEKVRKSRALTRARRRKLGVPVVALVGYTNSGKSSLLNALAPRKNGSPIFAADMLFATLDPTTRMASIHEKKEITTSTTTTTPISSTSDVDSVGNNWVEINDKFQVTSTSTTTSTTNNSGTRNRRPDMLFTDTVGFIQKLPTHLVASFRATLEEIHEADLLLHVTDVTNNAWRKQEASVLRELTSMGLENKPILTVWNKVDLVPETKTFLEQEASRRNGLTVVASAKSGEGLSSLMDALTLTLEQQMIPFSCSLPFENDCQQVVSALYSLGSLDEVHYSDAGVLITGKAPPFLVEQVAAREGAMVWNENGNPYTSDDSNSLVSEDSNTFSSSTNSNQYDYLDDEEDDEDWKAIAKKRKTEKNAANRRVKGVYLQRSTAISGNTGSSSGEDIQVDVTTGLNEEVEEVEELLVLDDSMDGQWLGYE